MKYKHTQIKRRTDGRWYARYKLANGKYYDIYGRTQAECYEKLKAFANNKKLLSDKIKALSSPPIKKPPSENFLKRGTITKKYQTANPELSEALKANTRTTYTNSQTSR